MKLLTQVTIICALLAICCAFPEEMMKKKKKVKDKNKAPDCRDKELEAFNEDMTLCHHKSEESVRQVVDLDGEFNKDKFMHAMCDMITKTVSCMEDILPRCYNEDDVSNLKFGYLMKQFQIASTNGSVLLGPEFITNCEVLRYICPIKECSNEAEKTRSAEAKAMDMVHSPTTKMALSLSSWCNYRNRLHSCHLTFMKCFSEEEASEWLKDRESDFRPLEKIIQRYDPDFSWSSSCGLNIDNAE